MGEGKSVSGRGRACAKALWVRGETNHGVNGEVKEGQSGWTERRVPGERRRQGRSEAPIVRVRSCDPVVECVCVWGCTHAEVYVLLTGRHRCVCTSLGMHPCAGPRTCTGTCKSVHKPVCSCMWGQRRYAPQCGAGLRCVRVRGSLPPSGAGALSLAPGLGGGRPC